MSKELTPLEALKRHRKSIDDLLDNGSILPELHYVFMQELDIIETALKEYEGAKNHIEALNKERIENSIKIKAFEIIKREIDIIGLIEDGVKLNAIELTKEEYNLLKEIL